MVRFRSANTHCHNILKTVNILRLENILCDVRILAGRQEIHAHRCVLIAGSEFFRSSLLGEYIDEREPVVDLSSVTTDAEIVEAIVNFLYLGEINIDVENLDSIVKVASFLSISDVKNFCCTFMLHTLDVNSCLKYHFIAKEFLFPEVERKAVSVVVSRFHDAIIFQEIARKLPPEELQNLLIRYDIFKHCSVVDILEYITSWVSLGGTERHDKTGCDILDYVISEVVGKGSDTLTEQAICHLSMEVQSEKDETEFVKKLQKIICFLESKGAENNFNNILPKVEPEDIDDIASATETKYPKEDDLHMETSDSYLNGIEERTITILGPEEMKTEADSSISTSAKEELNLEIAANSNKAINSNDENERKTCNVCGRQFNRFSNLLKHRTTHSTDRPYSCKVCSKNYKRKETLNCHMLQHSGKKNLCCSVCQKRFYTKTLLTSHMIIHSGIKAYVCNVCGSAFSYKSNLTSHLKIHSKVKIERESEKQYPCSECSKQFRLKHHLTQHMVSHTGVKAYKCEICTKAFAHRAIMISHMKAHFGRQYTCSQCGKTFNYLSNLQKHKIIHSTDRPLHTCTICEKRYSSKGSLKIHMRSHLGEKPHSCSLCQKLFKSKNGLKGHLLIHAGDRRHICSICGQGFVQAGQLNSHMTRHSSEKTHACEICQNMFKTKSELKNHMKSHSLEKLFTCETCGAQLKYRQSLVEHVNLLHKGTVSHPCKICGRTFRWRSGLYVHLTTHAEERNHVCSTCGKQFKLAKQLKRHINIHTGEKSYGCKECGHQFSDNGALKRHSLIHTGEKRHTCTLCGKHFTRLENLKGHMKRFHPSA